MQCDRIHKAIVWDQQTGVYKGIAAIEQLTLIVLMQTMHAAVQSYALLKLNWLDCECKRLNRHNEQICNDLAIIIIIRNLRKLFEQFSQLTVSVLIDFCIFAIKFWF